MKISFTVEGKPIPKARPRVINGKAFTPKTTRDWENLVAWSARAANPGAELLDGDLMAVLHFRGAHASADLDNLAKGCLDAMNGVVYRDDKQVVNVWMTKTTSTKLGPAGVDIEVETLP